jgi:hypothetical protein
VGAAEHLLVHADTHHTVIALGLLALEGLGFLGIYLGVLTIISPRLVKDIAAAVRRRRDR